MSQSHLSQLPKLTCAHENSIANTACLLYATSDRFVCIASVFRRRLPQLAARGEREENVELATEPLLLQMDLRASQVQDDDDDER